MKCELCDSDSTFHATEVQGDGSCTSRHLCAVHARDAGYPVPIANEVNANVISSIRMLTEFMRTHRRMPMAGELFGMHSPNDMSNLDAEVNVDAYILYLESLEDFITINGRLPSDEELPDPF